MSTTATVSNIKETISAPVSERRQVLIRNNEGQQDSALECDKERLKRHRVDVASSVWIPDIWGQEDLLKDWIDCTVFDASLTPKGLMSAREALAQEQQERRRVASCSSVLELGTASC